MWIGLVGLLGAGCGATCLTLDCLSVAVVGLGDTVVPEAGAWKVEVTRDGQATLVCGAEVEAVGDALVGDCGDRGTGFEVVGGSFVVTLEDTDAVPDGAPVAATVVVSFEGEPIATLSGTMEVTDTRWLCQPKRAGGVCVDSTFVAD